MIELPDYIAELGVDAQRDAAREVDRKKSLKQNQRDKMRAKMSTSTELALNDEKRLRDALFKWQTTPALTPLGDTYY